MKGHSLPYYLGGLCLMAVLFFGPNAAYAQGVSVGDTDALPHPSAMLDVQSVNKGLLIPRMNYPQRVAIAAPANGLLVYQIANQAVSGVLYRRGFWYWDEIQNKWIHLGDERAGVVDQTANSIESTLSDFYVAQPDEGQNIISWGLTPYSAPPTVLVVPEFSSVATPPDITDYCQPDNTGCGANRANSVSLYHPNYLPGVTPAMKSWLAHPSCTGSDMAGSNASSYKYLPYPSGTGWVNNSSRNWGTVDLCAEPSETLGMWVRVFNNTIRSFRIFIDKNQDGDFDDPGEQIGTFENQGITGASEFIWGGGGTSLPALILPPDLVDGVTKLRVIMRRASNLANNPCYPGDPDTYIYDFDVNVECGGGGLPFYANDLNWCNVDDVTNTTARVSCFDQNGSATDTKYHYKVIPHD